MKKPNLILMLLPVTILSAFSTKSPEWKFSNGYSYYFLNDHASGMFDNNPEAIQFNENAIVNTSFKTPLNVASIATGLSFIKSPGRAENRLNLLNDLKNTLHLQIFQNYSMVLL